METLQTVDRALRLLELVQHEPVVTLKRAADELGVGTSVAHRLLASLEARGFVRRSLDGPGYRLGPAMIGMTPAHADADYVAVAQEDLFALQAATGETVEIAVLEGAVVRYIFGIASQQSLRIEPRAGTVLPAHTSACGRALLAAVGSTVIRRTFPTEYLPQAASTTTPNRTALEAELERVRLRGYARNIEETAPGIAALAQTVLTPGGFPSLAVTVSGPQPRLRFSRSNPDTGPERRFADALRQTVLTIQAKLTQQHG